MTYETDERERIFTGHSGRLFLLLTGTLVCIRLTQRLLPPLLPAIIDELGITAFLAGIALTVLRISRASMQYPGGRIADQLSRTTVILCSLGFVIVGVAVLSISVTYGLFLVGLTIFGMGIGLYNPASRALLSDLFRKRRGSAFGLHMMGSDLPGVLAAGIAIWIVSIATWRAAFPPLLLVLLPLPVLFYVLSREPVRIERIDFPMLRMGRRLFGDPSIRWLVFVYSLFVIASSGVVSFLPTFLIEVHGFSFALASSAFALVYGVGIVAKPLGGYVSDRLPRPVVAGGGLLVASIGLALLIAWPGVELILAGVALTALGQRSVPPTLQAYLMDQFPDDSMGSDLGTVHMIYLGIGSLGPAYTGFIASTLGFVPAYITLLCCFFLAGAILLWFSHRGWPTA